MTKDSNRDPMLDMFIFETMQLIEQLEQSVLDSEKTSGFKGSINEIFRIMHTIKGSAAMMMFNNISSLAHALEDIFYLMREENPVTVDYSRLSDIVLEGVDFFKNEIRKIEEGNAPDGNPGQIVENARGYLSVLKQSGGSPEQGAGQKQVINEAEQKYYISSVNNSAAKPANGKKFEALVIFEEDCGMEHIRAFTVIQQLKEIAGEIEHYPEDIIDGEQSLEKIKQEGFRVFFSTQLGFDEVQELLLKTMFLKNLELKEVETFNSEYDTKKPEKKINLDDPGTETQEEHANSKGVKENTVISSKQSMISVSVSKLDKLMDLVGELVISESMVTHSPELEELQLDGFYKAARQLHKITNELQDSVMSVRMVPLSMTFQKMNRIVRDMSKKLDKEVELEIIGEETEVDKNIIEHISDPLMHIIRNSLDHGIEPAEERRNKGKSVAGKIVLEAKNSGGDVWIIVRDDGKGLDKDRILEKARKNGLLTKPESELTDRDIYAFIFLPGFSTKEKVTEFSGRGVGMDVVTKNIEKIGGTVMVDSTPGHGTVMSIKIPLTLAIIDGMVIKVGNAKYTIPTTGIKESIRVKESNTITDPDGNEMIMIRGECYPVYRLHQKFNVRTDVTKIHEGIIVMVEDGSRNLCLFADGLLGEQQVVVKALPRYIKKIKGLAGCTLLGDGNISLILDIAGLLDT